MFKLTKEGKKYLEKGLPEKQLVLAIKDGPKELDKLKKEIEKFPIAIQWAKKKKWISIEKGKAELDKDINEIEKDTETEENLKKVKSGEEPKKLLLERNLVEEIREDIVKEAKKYEGKEIANIHPSLIKTGLWRKAKIKEYNVKATGKKVYPGKKHILTRYIEKIRKTFLELGFKEMEGPLIESSFWNFDALYQPQDHPARDLADTFYMETPEKGELPGKNVVEEVAKTHENGANTGSNGWGYKWSKKLAKKAILRTHTTAVSARALQKLEPPEKIFSVGRVFRNETIDYKHLPEFTQIEGIVVDEDVSFRDLLGYLKEFYKRMGFKKIRFRPAYFPYTEMSVEPEVYFPEKKEWIELGGSGIFRPEVTIPLGIESPVLAWGLGLERLIMLRMGINDIRNFYYQNNLKLLREAEIWQ